MMSQRTVQQGNLLAACARGDFEFLQQYIQKNPQKSKYEVFDNHKWGALHHAVASNSYDCVQLMLSSGLVEPRWKSFEGQTCLLVAIERRASQAIIKALITADAELFDMPNNENVYPIHKAVLKNSLQTIKTMLDTLREMNVTFADQFDLDGENSLFLAARSKNLEIVKYLLSTGRHDTKHLNEAGLNAATAALLPFEGTNDGDVQDSRFEIFKRLIPLTYDITDDDFMQQMMLPISFVGLFKHFEIFHWILDEYYFTDFNDHAHLVDLTVNTMHPSLFDYQMIIYAMHSKLDRFIVSANDTLKNDLLYSNFFIDLSTFFDMNPRSFPEIMAIVRPKLDSDSLQYVMLKFVPNIRIDGTPMLDMYVQMFDILRISDLVNIQSLLMFTPSITYLNNLLLLMMPFSTAPSADYYLEACMDGGILTDLSPYDQDEGLARFCVKRKYRSKCDLKSLCRAVVRSSILSNSEDGTTNEQRLNRIRSMEIPIPIKNFLLFNYTRYDFK